MLCLYFTKKFHKGLTIFTSRKISKNVHKGNWKSVVGLEVHAQISSISKLFSGAPTKFSSPVNSNVSLFDCSIPGTLPVLNKRCVEAGVLTALALNCKVQILSTFDRKHYFYADMPAGYQITQQRSPLAIDGLLEFQVYNPGIHKIPYRREVRIKQVQLEQDSGKSLHDFDRSLVDLNRAGVPLMEVVFEPDLSDGEEAAALVKELVTIFLRIRTCSCKMEEGALRVDANVSIHKEGEPLGTRTEIKNIGSVRAVAGAIRYEIDRQIKLKESGGTVTNETRSWDAESKSTVAMRDKEVQQDYRYMPEPNLPPLLLSMGDVKQGCVNVDELKKAIPELPAQTRTRLQEDSGLTLEQSIILVNEDNLLKIFQGALKFSERSDTKLLANFLINDYIMLLNKANLEPSEMNLNADDFGELVELMKSGTVSRNTARLILNEIIKGTDRKPSQIMTEKNWMQITNEEDLKKICADIINENEKLVQQYRSGKIKVFKALLGLIAAKTQQRADMSKCNIILKTLLDEKK